MEKVREIAKVMGLIPKLHLGTKIVKPDGSPGGVEGTGPHTVKFVAEPTIIMGKDDKGNLRKEFKFVVEENGQQYRWTFPLLNKEGQPNYLVERMMDVKVGDERVLEMMRKQGRNYIDVRLANEEPGEPEEEVEIPVAEGQVGPLDNEPQT